MERKILRFLSLIFIIGGVVVLWTSTSSASTPSQFDDPIKQGEYLTKIAGCEICHTPYKSEYNDLPNLAPEDIQVLSINEHDALDTDRLLAGGRVFDLGPLGFVMSRNLTPDPETGLGEWTDEEIKTAIRTGVSRDGRQLFPLMPYRVYNQMAEADLDAIVAYLRSLKPIENLIPVTDFGLPPFGLPIPEEPIVAPDPEDTEARGKYLMTSVLPCTDCHTPLDETTGLPIMEMYFAGGQPYEGPWGIVYGSNITPDEKTGIGEWSDDDLTRVLVSGVRIDGRRVILMPWQDYANLTAPDVEAVISFLRSVEPIENEVPKAALQPGFEQFAE